MHNLFADWYRQVDLDASADRLTARWKCVESAVAALDAVSVLQLTRACFGLPKLDSESPIDGAAIIKVFKDADVSFPMKGNEQLLRVLFGVTLVDYIEKDRELATLAALAVSCAHSFGMVAAPAVAELISVAEEHLSSRGSARREEALEGRVAVPSFGKIVVTQPGAMEFATTNANEWPNVQQNFQKLGAWLAQVSAALEALTNGISKTHSETEAAFKAILDRAVLDNRIAVLKEECNVLWWLFGEHSQSANKRWSDARASELCLILGRELADLMTFEEPTPNATSFLAKALSMTASNTEALNVKEVLEACDDNWRKSSAEGTREAAKLTGAVTPVHTGLVYRVDSSTRWMDLLVQGTAMKLDHRLPPVQWAEQVYREGLLFAALERARG